MKQSTQHMRYLLLSFFAGAITLMYEVYSLKVVHFYIVKSDHAISITLAAFLAGLAFASLIFSKKVQHQKIDGKKLIIILYLLSALYTLFVLKNINLIPTILDGIQSLGTEHMFIFTSAKLVIVFIYLFIPAFLLGGTFPIFNGLYQKNYVERYENTGIVYFYDTCGAIAGSLVSGFVLIPFLGLEYSLIVPLLLTAGTSIMLTERRVTIFKIILGYLIIIFIFFQPPSRDIRENVSTYIPYDQKFGTILFQEPSNYGVVTIGDMRGNKTLFINYRDMCSVNMNETESELGTFTMKNLRGEHLSILNIGLGCGFTAGAVTRADTVDELTIIEINDVIININQEFFGAYNGNLVEDDRVTIRNENGVDVIRNNDGTTYDAIIIDIEEPTVIQSSPMYTLEYIRMAKEKLNEGGIFSMWAIEGGSREYDQILYNTLSAVFEYVYIRNDHSVQLYASDRPLDIISSNVKQWDTELTTVNTLDNRALEEVFNIYEIFNIPKEYHDPFINE